jgi:4-amino-4-deoxy-L-arabinose transferase-like glycosyltransferase
MPLSSSSLPKPRRRTDLIILLALLIVATVVIFWRLGEGSLSDYDEADYAQSAREMLWWNDFNTPRWNGMEFFDKPPLNMWLTALAYKVFGVNEFGARVVSATAGVLVILLTYILGRDLFASRTIGLGAALMLLTVSNNLYSHGYNLISLARVGQLDMTLILWMALSVWLAWRSQRSPRALIWLGVPLGLGLITKSVAGLMAYGIVALFLLGSGRRSWWRRETALGILISAAISTPWHVGQLLIWGRHFWNSYMVSLTVGYVTGDQGHTRDALFYLRSIQRGFPILYPLVAAAVVYGIYRLVRHRDRAALLLLCWTAVPFALYNVGRSKIGWYMIPIYPAMALLAMRLLVRVLLDRLALIVVVAAVLAFNPWLPSARDFNPGVKSAAMYSRYVLGSEDILINYFPGSLWSRPSALFYADPPMRLVTSEERLRALLAAGDSSSDGQSRGSLYILTDWHFWEPVQELGKVVYRSGGYVLAAAQGGGGPTTGSSANQ